MEQDGADDTAAVRRDDPLDALRAQLDRLDHVAVESRPEVFEQVNDALVAELNALDGSRSSAP